MQHWVIVHASLKGGHSDLDLATVGFVLHVRVAAYENASEVLKYQKLRLQPMQFPGGPDRLVKLTAERGHCS